MNSAPELLRLARTRRDARRAAASLATEARRRGEAQRDALEAEQAEIDRRALHPGEAATMADAAWERRVLARLALQARAQAEDAARALQAQINAEAGAKRQAVAAEGRLDKLTVVASEIASSRRLRDERSEEIEASETVGGSPFAGI